MSGQFDVLQHVPMPIYVFRVVGEDFILEDVNATGRALNPALVSMRGRSMTHLYADQPQALEDGRRAVREKTTVVREMAVRRYDRTEATQFVRLSYVYFDPDHMVIFMQDIATPPIAEAALRESEARYRGLVDSLPDAVLLRGGDGRVLACNDVAVRLFGAKSQFDLLGVRGVLAPGLEVRTESGELVPPEELPSLKVLATGRPDVGQVYALVAPDTVTWFLVAAQPIRSASGVVTGSVTTFSDVTERIVAQRALRESRARLDLALTAARMGVWEFEPATDRGYWSDNLYTVFQLAPRPPGFSEFLRCVHPDDRNLVVENTEKIALLSHGDSFEHEFRIVGDDEVTRWARVQGTVAKKGTGAHLSGTIMDVTERYHLEEELRRAHRLESIGRLAGGIAHDFNNLLAAMMGSLEMLEAQCPPAAAEDLNTIRHGTTRARDLTRQLLAFARKQPVTYKVLDLGSMVVDVERMLGRLVGADVELAITSDGPVHVRADASLLEQVLVNLVVNASEAMPRGGRLDVRVGRASRAVPGAEESKELAVLEVIDSGIGMDDETRRQIFDPFFTTKASGTGLGLASSYGIIKQHGGDIEVETQPGRGARFRVLLPRLLHADQAADAVPRESAKMGKGVILIVDDEELVRRTASRLLVSLGYEVLAAAGAEQALAYARNPDQRIDAVLCDVAMPDKDGPTVARELQAIRPGLRVLYASGYASYPGGEQALGKSFLPKPYSRADLAAKLEELFAEEQPG